MPGGGSVGASGAGAPGRRGACPEGSGAAVQAVGSGLESEQGGGGRGRPCGPLASGSEGPSMWTRKHPGQEGTLAEFSDKCGAVMLG